ncbi:hypothetical protein IC235_02290 [Hymenobacter sp. BT664]|uniref:Uncharacterized protein n=1 Tax=Hymenobacter montanus TaxID=2771359 RepID=A0A927GHS5_9BACT|nr:hypothetical protein [Hymenobacter montanus]
MRRAKVGLAATFATTADFMPIDFQGEAGRSVIEQVVHKTFLAVDKQGTEAVVVMALYGLLLPATALR